MNVAERFAGKSDSVAHLPVGVLYMLSSGKVSAETVEQMISGQMPPTAAVQKRRRRDVGESKTPFQHMELALPELFSAWQANDVGEKVLQEEMDAVETFIFTCEQEGIDARDALLLAAQAIMEGVKQTQ